MRFLLWNPGERLLLEECQYCTIMMRYLESFTIAALIVGKQ